MMNNSRHIKTSHDILPDFLMADLDEHRFSGCPHGDTTVEFRGRFAISGEQKDEFLEAIREVLERFQI